MKRTHLKQISAAVIGAFLLAPAAGWAADNTATKNAPAANTAQRETTQPVQRDAVPPATQRDATSYSDRARMKTWSDEQTQLKSALKLGQDKNFYKQALEQRGYQITSVNDDKADYVEWEVVKGSDTYEVKVDFDKSTGKAKKVDIDPNLWRTDATKAALAGKRTPASTAAGTAPAATTAAAPAPGANVNTKDRPHAMTTPPASGNYSDRSQMKTWTSEKDKLKSSLTAGKTKDFYADQLKKMGYQITSVNDSEADYVEYEVVKGKNSYEVQIDFDKSGKAKDVDVHANMWQAESTERALEGKR